MARIFLIPGLGADERIYRYIDLLGHGTTPVKWLEPEKKDTLSTYAQKLIDHYSIKPQSIVIGNSLGGMLCIEIAKKVELKKAILISSIKTVHEAPRSYRWWRYLPFYKLVPPGWLSVSDFVIRKAMGNMSRRNLDLFVSMFRGTSPRFIKWAIGAILNWENEIIPPNVYHITGDRDFVFPARLITGATIVKGGTHIMILTKAKQINSWLNQIIN